jgi:tetratricopeptide (TPR) repeat protein
MHKTIFKTLALTFLGSTLALSAGHDLVRESVQGSVEAVKAEVMQLVRNKRILTAAKKIAKELKSSKSFSAPQKQKLESLMWSLADTGVNILVKSGDLNKAADFVHKLLLEYPRWSHGKDAFRRVAFLHGMAGNWVRSQKMARSYLKTTTTDEYTPDMLYLLAVSLEQMGHIRQASLTLRRFVQLFPDHENLSSAKSKLADLSSSARRKL